MKKCNHITNDIIKKYLSIDEDSITEEDLIFFQDFDYKLDNCETCHKNFQNYNFFAALIHYEDIDDDEAEEDFSEVTNTNNIILIKKKGNYRMYGDPQKRDSEKKAAAANRNFNSYLKVQFDTDGICGILDFTGDMQEYAQLILKFKEPQDKIPFGLKACFYTLDNPEQMHTIEIPMKESHCMKNDEGKITAMKSTPQSGIDLSCCIKSDYTITIFR